MVYDIQATFMLMCSPAHTAKQSVFFFLGGGGGVGGDASISNFRLLRETLQGDKQIARWLNKKVTSFSSYTVFPRISGRALNKNFGRKGGRLLEGGSLIEGGAY